ncbi:MAG TPA: aldehyde dehydrogenase family protein, partial [Afifellaceae bacterium]|nr:aldehyde dehydrogenase family protein [Afifellaceae bacterium]
MTKITCTSPIDGSVFAERKVDSLEDVEARLERARGAQKDWSKRPLEERVTIVEKAVSALEAMNDEIVVELAHQMGRPVRYGGEIGGVKERAFHMTSIAAQALAPMEIEISDAFHRYIAREPVGIVFVVAPWNYPYLTAINSIAPALVAGNAVALKHATQTLLAGERFEQAFRQAGLPDDLFHNLRLSHDLTERLIAARSFDFINFTGSVGGGKAIEHAAAGTFVGTALELGGKDPGYVRADADLDAAVDTLIDGAMFNSGQCCCGIERIYVHESLFAEFVTKAKAIVEGYRLGDPLDPETTLGPMAHARFAEEVRAQISEAVAAGATPVIDQSLFPQDRPGTAWLAPQILVDVDHSMRVMREESFGPVVGIMKVSSDDEAIALMNDSDFGLTASLWTKD